MNITQRLIGNLVDYLGQILAPVKVVRGDYNEQASVPQIYISVSGFESNQDILHLHYEITLDIAIATNGYDDTDNAEQSDLEQRVECILFSAELLDSLNPGNPSRPHGDLFVHAVYLEDYSIEFDDSNNISTLSARFICRGMD